MKFFLEPELYKTLQVIKKKNPKLYKKIQKQLLFFQQNPNHPSLRNHKLKGNLSKGRSISIEGNLRMLYYLSNDQAIFFDIGTHDEVYRK